MSGLIKLFLGALIWIVFFPLVSPLLLCLFVYRQFVNLVSKLWDPSLELLGYVDHALAFGSSDKEIDFMLAGALRIEGNLDIHDLRRHFRKTYMDIEKPYYVFYQYLVTRMGYVFRKRVENIDLSFHIREIYNENVTRDFDKILNQIMEDNGHLRGGVPPWEMLLLQNPVKEESVLIVKIHHGLADGCAFNYLLDLFTENKSPYIVKPFQESLWLKLMTILQAPVNALEMYRTVRPLKTHPFGVKPNPHPKKFFTSTTTVDCGLVKSVRKKTGARIIPILISANFEALKTSLHKLGKISDSSKSSQFYRSNYLLPIPNHPAILESRIENHCVTGGVLISMQDLDSGERVDQIQKSFTEFLEKGNDRILAWSSRFSYLIPNCIIKISVENSFRQMCHSSVLTTMMISSEKYQVLGKPVKHINGCMNPYSSLQFSGILISAFTMGDALEICVRGTRELFETQEELDLHVKTVLPEEFRKLKERCNRQTEGSHFYEV